MIGKEVLGAKPVTIHEVKELLTGIEGESTYEQKITREYVDKISKIPPSEARELVSKLVDAGLSEELAVKIVNVMPKDAVDVHTLLAKEKDVSEDLYGKILEILGK